MSLHGGIDTVAIATAGVFSKTFGQAEKTRRFALYASAGFLDRAFSAVVIAAVSVVLARRRAALSLARRGASWGSLAKRKVTFALFSGD